MKKVVRLTESQLIKFVKRVLVEQGMEPELENKPKNKPINFDKIKNKFDKFLDNLSSQGNVDKGRFLKDVDKEIRAYYHSRLNDDNSNVGNFAEKHAEVIQHFRDRFNSEKISWYLYTMKKIIKLTESDLFKIVKKVILESTDTIGGELTYVKDIKDGIKVYGKNYGNYTIYVMVTEINDKDGNPRMLAKVQGTPTDGKENYFPTVGSPEDKKGGFIFINDLNDPILTQKYIPMVHNKFGNPQTPTPPTQDSIAGELKFKEEKNGIKLYSNKYRDYAIKVLVRNVTKKDGTPITIAKVMSVINRPTNTEEYNPTEGSSDDIGNGYIVINDLNDPKLMKYISMVRKQAELYRRWDDLPKL